MELSKKLDKTILSHAEDIRRTYADVMNEGVVSRELNLPGTPAEAEEILVYREIALARLTGACMHILHVSTAGSIERIRQAQRQGIRVIGEAWPRHFSLIDKCACATATATSRCRRLCAQRDVEAILNGLHDGTLDVISTDHAPHAEAKKAREFELASNGIIGQETLLPVCITTLILLCPSL